MRQRTVVDTNVWISGLLNPNGFPAKVIEAVRYQQCCPILSPRLFAELERVGRRPRLRDRFVLGSEALYDLFLLLRRNGELTADPTVVPICRDPRDDIFIAVALATRAPYLVTRDDDLKGDPNVLGHMEGSGTEILTVRRFLEVLAAS